MNKLTQAGRNIFSLGIIALAIVCIISKDFIVGRPPAWPANFILNPALAYISAVVLIIAALLILLNRRAALAALIIAVLIFLLSALRHIPQFMADWLNTYKTFALIGGALIIAASFSTKNNNISGLKMNDGMKKNFILTGTALLAVFFISAGYAHFKFADFVNTFIPAYIPFHPFWTYFCGICLFAGGVGILISQTRRIASLLSGIMVLGWFLLLHIPRFITNMNDASDRIGLCESFTFVGIFFVLAGIFSEKSN